MPIVLSDLAAALAGSLGIAPTPTSSGANLSVDVRAIHGSAFDIIGKGIANPIGTFWSAVMMLEHVGRARSREPCDAGDRARHCGPALHTPDLGGKARTEQVTAAVIEHPRAND